MNSYKKILVTGGAGAIASQVISRLKLRYPNTIFLNLDALTYAGRMENVELPHTNYKFIYGDICDANLVSHILETERPDCVMHFAAETHVDNSFGNSFKFTTTNIYGTHVMLECVRKHMQNHPDTFTLFLHMITDEVYGSVSEHEPSRLEGALFSPSNPYAATKAAAELICQAYQRSFKVPIIITRCNNAISKVQHEEKLIPRTITSIMNGQRVPIHGRGESKRTFIHVYDIADAMDVILHGGKVNRVYNIGTEQEYSVLDVVQMILDIMKPGSYIDDHIVFVEDRVFQDYRYSIDTTALSDLGWKPTMSFEDGIRDVIHHMTSKKL